ncbi:hypothetical protein [Mycobacterium arosiense]|uniref:Uncharacterized protein n=1 Tax=Mycobacterium arosiense ATCC BAA-1401 = DSM 45069 TaxID=1265311 RepID=A0A1W9ZBU7_MYCAI|nr:hypothetical protein [Mycobacterium arosiense]ORA11423.1 hypothetical protein BST14_18610 [Mycobacterium arosiense ATCC BAA-1401 = DSM 45069]
MGAGFLLAQIIPPPGPYDAHTTARYFHDYLDLKRLGIICVIVAGTMMIPFGAAVADRLRRVEGVGTTAANTELGAAIASATLLMVFGPMVLVGLQRPDMPESTYQLINHATWMAWGGLWEPGALQAVATATAIFCDKSPSPVFPRWFGWYSLFMAFGSLMGSLIPFFTGGPFAWNGAVGFFVAAMVYFAWFAIMLTQLHLVCRRGSVQGPDLNPVVASDAPAKPATAEAMS